jgi:hypothetical protein
MRFFLWLLLGLVYPITGLIVHIWTVGVAYTYSGLLAAIFSFFFPVISELYWVFALWTKEAAYAKLAAIHLVLLVAYYGYRRMRRREQR